MRDATVTAFALPQGLRERVLLAAWAGITAGTGCAGLAMHAALAADADSLSLWGACGGALGGCIAMVLAWRASPASAWQLEWRGQACSLMPADDPAAACEGAVHPMLDLGGWLLLRFRPADGRRERWLSASARHMGPSWHLLRAALYRPDRASATWRRG